MTQPLQQRLDSIAARWPPRRCAVPGCTRDAYRLGSRCMQHDRNTRHTGHPTAREITAASLRPYVKAAQTFVDQQAAAGHPGVAGVAAWLREKMERAQPVGALHRGTAAPIRWSHWLAKFRVDAVQPEQIIAVCIAAHWHRLNDPRAWPDDRYFLHQLGKHVLGVSGRRSHITQGERVSSAPLRKPSGVLLLAGAEMERAFGSLSARAAQHLDSQASAEPAERLPSPAALAEQFAVRPPN